MDIIKNIKIRYFRSIYTANINNCKSLNIISGKNDAGKSNVLKALNLFFNNLTDWDTPISFYRDFSASRLDDVRKKSNKGKQFISIEIEFNRPNGYKGSLPKNFKVTRTWTRDSSIYSEKNNLETLSKLSKLPSSLPTASRFLSGLLNKIHFEYIPAVKDRIYFKHLLARLQAALLEKPLEEGSPISETTDNLAKHIENQINQLQNDFKRATGLETSIEPPKEIASLFQSFQVSTKTGIGALPLQLRGDGLQARYVPSVLHYISTNSNKIFIWGFEEPENSLEYHNTSMFANDFCNKYTKEAQIFITTHSPAFVSLQEKNTLCLRVFQEEGKSEIVEVWPTIKNKKHFERLREEIGIIEIQQEVHSQYKSRLIELESTKKRLIELENEISTSHKPLVLTEGTTDKLILETAWNKLYSTTESPYIFRAADPAANSEQGGAGGAQSLKRMIESIHPDDGRKVIALFDRDDEGVKVFDNLSRNFKKLERYEDTKYHINGFAYAVLLLVPDFRVDFGNANNMCIELMFRDEIIKNKTPNGLGLQIEKPTINAFNLGSKRVDTIPQYLQDAIKDLPGYHKITAGKEIFASEIVPTLVKDDFASFERLFNLFGEIINASQWHAP